MSEASARAHAPDTSAPGRVCPTSYRYSPRVFRREPDLAAETLYVVGGLYGNVEALDSVQALAARDCGGATLVFNGDFHWFDVDGADFAAVSHTVLGHAALRGNVETEIAADASDAGCGCAYPADVSDAEVSRSNEILARLRDTARGYPALRPRLAALPMHLVAQVGDARVGIVHGDATSLAGWGFAVDRLDDARHRRWIASVFADAAVDVFASSHTCRPAIRQWSLASGSAVVANNGAAGMPNFTGRRRGLVTRIGLSRFTGSEALYGVESHGVHIQAIELAYDEARWAERFAASWPPGSAAHASYFTRIAEGPRFTPERAAPRA